MPIWVFILSIYLFTVLITFPFIYLDTRKMYKNEEDRTQTYLLFHPKLISKVLAFVPLLNLKLGFDAFVRWRAWKAYKKKVDDIANRAENPELKEMLKTLSEKIGNYNDLEDEKESAG